MMRIEEMLPSILCLVVSIAAGSAWVGNAASTLPAKQIERGFSATHDPSYSEFQPLLADPNGVFSLGFLRFNSTQLELAVLHLPSSLPVWRANQARPALWTRSTSFSFNGTLVLSDPETGVIWSTPTAGGDRLVLLDSSNLQIQKLGDPVDVLWQSFDFPSDTLVQNQTFTSKAALLSTNRRYSMRLGSNYFALYMEVGEDPSPMYWKHTAMEARAQIVPGEGSIYARVEPAGFLGMYQNEKAPVDVLPFDTFSRGISGLRRLTLEPDGNLRAYYWNGSTWVRDFTAITEPCGLPSTCGPYELCSTGEPRCKCLDNSTDRCLPAGSGDLCASEGDDFWVLRRKGVDLANKELLGFQKVGSLAECEDSCERNCSCWGAVFNNATGYCYGMDYPIGTVVEGDEGKVGYFKVRGNAGGGGREGASAGKRTRAALLVIGVVIFAGAAGFGAYQVRNRMRMRGGVDGSMTEGLAPGPYKDLSSASFRSIELSNSFKK
ncbi:PAN domain-containing protein At5g03700-like [Elaeis guineensis]|uniref:PAN domain-containing protein At5g03700-like n=1 Tax=Elaeis guineensis var. tenera TaxID=51953 RepID=UPI003C6D809D